MRSVGSLAVIAILSIASLASGPAWSEDNTAEFDVSRYDGKIVLLDFWASWCGPCAESFPWMSEMNARYAEQGLVVVGVNLDENRDDAERFLAEHPSDFAQVFNPEGTLAEAYGVDTMPTSILIDRNGKVVARHRGFRLKETDDYERNLVALLNGETLVAGAYSEAGESRRTDGVRPWDKGVLALPEMAFSLDSLDLEIDDHIYFSKEASSGGRGLGGGGCGCN